MTGSASQPLGSSLRLVLTRPWRPRCRLRAIEWRKRSGSGDWAGSLRLHRWPRPGQHPLTAASADATPDRECGHGLLIVDAVAEVGIAAGRPGKSVWFEITTPRNSKRECALSGEP